MSQTPPPRARATRRSLSDELRDELAHIAVTPTATGWPSSPGSSTPRAGCTFAVEGRSPCTSTSRGSAVARRAFRLLRELGVTSELRTYRQRAFAKPTRYQVHVEGGARALRRPSRGRRARTRGSTPVERPPRQVVRRSCCRRAYLRGALLGGGSVTGPRCRPHLEIRVGGVDGAEFLVEIAAREALSLRVLDRGRHAAAYAKGAETIADVLAAAGASDAVLVFEERAVLGATTVAREPAGERGPRESRPRRARRAPAGPGGARSSNGPERLATLPPTVREAAELRLRHPSLSLRDLAPKCRPPVTKATLHRRLRRVVEAAEAQDAVRNEPR